MEAVASSPDGRAADLIQRLSMDSESKTIQVPESGNRSGPAAKGTSRPFYPNARFVPSGHPTAYFYGGYNDQGYGDTCSYMYHQGYGFTPYGLYPPGSSAPTMQHNGQLDGLQQYQYPCSYYQPQVFEDGSYAPDKHSVTQREISSSVTVNHVPSSFAMNRGNTVGIVNGDCSNNNAFNKAHLTRSFSSSLNSNDFYPGASFPAYFPWSGYQDTRFSTDRTQSAFPSNALFFSDKPSKHGARFGSSSPMIPGKDFSSQRNQNLALSLPYYAGARPSSGLEPFSGYMNSMYPSNKTYCQYGNTWSISPHGSAYGSRAGYVPDRLKASSNNRGGSGNWKKNVDGFNEMSKGPRATNCDNKSDSYNKEKLLVPVKEKYNGEDLSESYSDAKIFVIKSYNEDDIHKSIKCSVWASTPNGNRKLNAAYEEAKEKPDGCPVFLLFSVNSSGQFVGLAEMMGPVDFENTVEYWQQDRWTGRFPVKWHIIKDIPNIVLRKITLENNENKPVTNSRDTQEVMFEKGIQILNLVKEHLRKTCILDDFDFYEGRENVMQQRKSKEHELSRHVSEPGDTTNETVKLPESVEGSLATQLAPADLTSLSFESKVSPLEECGSAGALEDFSELPN